MSFTDLDKSPEMENLPQLDMNLLPELHDLIYRNNNSPNLNHQQHPQQVEPPKVNRQVSFKQKLDVIKLCNCVLN